MLFSIDELLAEEQKARDLPLTHAIHTAEVPSEDIAQRDIDVGRLADKYNNVFKTREDAEYFAMLPLSRTDRELVLARALHIEKNPGV